MHLHINKDLSTTYVPSKEEAEALVRSETVETPIYRYSFDEKKERIEIVYRQQVNTGQAIPLYQLKYFVMQEGFFDLIGFQSFFKACFPKSDITTLTKEEAKILCQGFYDRMKARKI